MLTATTKKKLTTMVGYIDKITEPELMTLEGKPTRKRSVVTIVTEDDQKAYFEIRDAVIARMDKLGFRKGDQVEIGYVLIGSEKAGRCYNNLFINQIDYVNKGH